MAFVTYKIFRGGREKLRRWDLIQNNHMNNQIFLEDELHGLRINIIVNTSPLLLN